MDIGIFGNRRSHERDDIADELVQVDEAHLEILLAGIGEHLVRQVGRLLGRLQDARNLLLRGRALREHRRGETCAPKDTCQEIVEIVGNTRGEHSEALELLRVLHLCFELLTLAHVGRDNENRLDDIFIFDRNEPREPAQPGCRQLQGAGDAVRDNIVESFRVRGTLTLFDVAHDVGADEILGREILKRVIDGEDRPVGIEGHDPIGGVLDERAKIRCVVRACDRFRIFVAWQDSITVSRRTILRTPRTLHRLDGEVKLC